MPIITHEGDRQTVVTTFETNPAQCDDLLETLSTLYEDFIRHQPGFVAAGLHVNDARTRIANYAQWESREQFLAMLRSTEMRARTKELTSLCRNFEPVMYDVAAVYFPEAAEEGTTA